MNIYDDIYTILLADRYRVTRRLGAGAFGDVYQAQHEVFGVHFRTLALKLFTKAVITRANAGEVFREALELEALVAEARTRGEETHLITVYDIGVSRNYHGIPYVAMELVDGGSLEDELRRAKRFPLQTVIRYARDICAGLTLAHTAGLIHRDLKPANVLITGNKFLKVADFGLAINRYEAYIQGGGGTISYAPPELLNGTPPAPSYDVYSLGVMMLEMLLGYNPLSRVLQRARTHPTPFEPELERAQEFFSKLLDPETGSSFLDSNVELGESTNAQEVLKGCLALHPAARYPNAGALDAELEKCRQTKDETIQRRTETAETKAGRLLQTARRNLLHDRLERAEELFLQLQAESPENPDAYFGLSEIHEKKGGVDKAIYFQEIGTKLLRIRSSMQRLARLYEQAGRAGEARVANIIAMRVPERINGER